MHPAEATTESLQVLTVAAGHSAGRYWRDLWDRRELFYFLAWRDLLVRYKQTALGVAWSILRPLLTMIVFTIVFGRLAGLPANGIPYPLLVLTALLPWQLWANSFSEASFSLVDNSALISKVYFPRLVIPASAIVVSLVDSCIAFVLLLLFLAGYRCVPDWRMVFLPAFLLLALTAALGFGLWITALNVKYRDFRYAIPFILQLGIYVSPVGFSSAVVPGRWRLLYSLNPMVGVIDGFRWAILGPHQALYWPGIALSTILALVVLVSGVRYFRSTERAFADII
jgi:lipopolysaccharide transport system permease protein